MRAALLVALVVACDTANHGTTQPHRFVEQLTASDHGEVFLAREVYAVTSSF
ncbi:MAG TPA: hypothetical protein VF403_18765 [Kofleriaceae bacterium]